MKKLAFTLAAAVITASAYGQGTVQFNNRVPGLVDARLVLPDGTGAGTGWTAQLYAGLEGTAVANLKPVVPVTTFRTTSPSAMGYVNPIDLAVPFIAGGIRATLIIRAYNGSSFETSALRYESNPVTVLLGGNNSPPSAPAVLIGLRTFTQVGQTESPVITVEPQSQIFVAGSTVTFKVEAKGTLPLRFQWKKNDVAIAGATSSALVLSDVSSSDVGRYSVVVSNAAGSITSQDALLSPPATDTEVGTVTFNNRVPGVVDVRAELRNGTPVSEGFTGQLFGGPEGGSLLPLLPMTTFRTGAAAGYVNPVTVNVAGVKPGGRATLVMRVFNGATFETSPVRLESNPFTLVLGGGTLPPVNLVGLERITELTAPAGPSFVKSVLPSGYAPGGKFLVTLRASPTVSVSVYAIEDRPPANWVVGKVSDDGKFDANTGKVKFGPFFDSNSRTLTYEVTPAAKETGPKLFVGSASADGVSTAIGGDRTIDLIKFHPADNSPADSRITINEATAYGAAWRKGATWPSGPNPIAIDYVTRAGTLWKNGEAYTIDPNIAGPPLWWVNNTGGVLRGLGLKNTVPRAASPSSVSGTLPSVFVPGETLLVQVSVQLAPGVAAYAIEERIPLDLVIRQISDGGEFDPINHRVKWGPFFDGTPRELSYELATGRSSPRLLAMTGLASFDGASVAIVGQRQSHASSRLGHVRRLPTGETEIEVTGRLDAKYVIEASTNLEEWEPLVTAPAQNGWVRFMDPIAANVTYRFYRAIAQ
ncbi:MAG: immunoglobulin domain-containing protein [Verrucomicrobia bacterium]|nr:immunoglobulin domain-containing protein [Verrucomicrobiota bacterium]